MISVVTVNYNGWELTSALIRSLECHVHTPLEVIVVDNGSRMDEAALLCARHPHIRAIRSHRNLGFAGGNNLGIAAASGQYLLLLNNDTEVEPGHAAPAGRTARPGAGAGSRLPQDPILRPAQERSVRGLHAAHPRHAAQRPHRLRGAG